MSHSGFPAQQRRKITTHILTYSGPSRPSDSWAQHDAAHGPFLPLHPSPLLNGNGNIRAIAARRRSLGEYCLMESSEWGWGVACRLCVHVCAFEHVRSVCRGHTALYCIVELCDNIWPYLSWTSIVGCWHTNSLGWVGGFFKKPSLATLGSGYTEGKCLLDSCFGRGLPAMHTSSHIPTCMRMRVSQTPPSCPLRCRSLHTA